MTQQGDPWGSYISEASSRFNIPENWIRAVMWTESRGQTHLHGSPTTSPAGAMGLMQVMPETYEELRQELGLGEDAHDPYNSIMAGTAYLRKMYDRAGTVEGMLISYNAGPGRFDSYKSGRSGLPEETQRYLDEILPRIEEGSPGPLASRLGLEPSQSNIFQDASIAQPASYQEMRIAEQQASGGEGPGGPSLGQLMQDAAASNWLIIQALKEAEAPAPDPSWEPDDEIIRRITEGIPEHYWGNFETAHSEAHALWLRDRTLEEMARNQRLAQAGWGGVGIQLVAGILDPASLLTLGAAGAAVQGGRAVRALKAGVSAAAFNAAYESALVSLRPTAENQDILWAAAGGMVFGTGFGAISRSTDLQRLSRQIQRDVEAENATGSVGAASAPRTDPDNLTGYELVAATEGAPEAAFGNVRFDATGRLKSSDNPVTRAVGNVLAEDGVGNRERSIATAISASEEQALIFQRSVTNFRRDFEPALREYMESQGISRWNLRARARARNEFNELTSRAVRSTDPLEEFDPSVLKGAEAWRKMQTGLWELAVDPGRIDGRHIDPVAGFRDVPENPNYLARYIDPYKVMDFINHHGMGGLEDTISQSLEQSLRAMGREVNWDLLDKVAKGYARRIKDLSMGDEERMARALYGEIEDVKALLQEVKVDQDAIDYIVDALEGMRRASGADEPGAPARGRRRLFLDENFVGYIRQRDGTFVQTRLDSIYNNNLEDIANRYAREMSGHIALARMQIKGREGEVLVDGVRTEGDWEKVKRMVRSSWEALGQGRLQEVRGQMDADLNRMDWLYRQIRGIPHPASRTSGGWLADMLTRIQYLRLAGQFGFAQIAEFGNILGQTGFEASLRSMPSLRSLVRDARTGRLSDELTDELEATFGIGAERLRQEAFTRWSEWGNPQNITGRSASARNASNAMDVGARFVSDWSLMNPINTALHRWSMRAITYRWNRLVETEGRTANMNRLRAMGVSDEMLPRILDQMKRYRSTGPDGTWRGGRLNMDRWQDAEARAAFQASLFRESRRIIQENDPGGMATWMSHPMSRIFLQFRTFIINAWSKQFLYNINMRDWQTFASFTMSSVFGGLSYIAQTHLRAQTVHPDKREEYLEQRLSTEAIGAASFQRAGWASLLPMLADSVVTGPLGQDPLFDYRSSGLATDWTGNPTFDWADKLFNAPGEILGPLLQGETPTAQNARRLMQALPFQNILPIQILYSALIDQTLSND